MSDIGALKEDERVVWPTCTEEYYWHLLVSTKPFRTIYAETPGSAPASLIDARPRNLSQHPREQCELEGLSTKPSELRCEGPGQEVMLLGLVSKPELNGMRGRVLPRAGRGAPAAGAPSADRVAVRLATG